MDWDDICAFIGQLVFTVVYMLIASYVGHLANVYVILFSAGMLFIAISSVLMVDHNGIGRIVVFFIGMLLLIVPSFVLNIICIVNKTGTFMEMIHFAASVGIVFVTWMVCGYLDGFYYMLNVLPLGGVIVLALIIKAIAKSVYGTSITLLVMGIVALIIMLIIRIANGSPVGD